MSDNYPPGVTGNEPQIAGWAAMDEFFDNLKPGDRVRAGGAAGTVRARNGDFCWVLLDMRTEMEPFEWEQIEPPGGWS